MAVKLQGQGGMRRWKGGLSFLMARIRSLLKLLGICGCDLKHVHLVTNDLELLWTIEVVLIMLLPRS